MRKIFTVCAIALMAVFMNGSKASAGAAIHSDDNHFTLTVPSATDKAKVIISIGMENPVVMSGFQWNLYIPTGAKFVYDSENECYLSLNMTRATTSHTANDKVQTDGSLMDLTYSSKSSNLKGNSGEIGTVTMDASALADGTYTIELKKSLMVWTDKVTTQEYDPSDISCTFIISGGKVNSAIEEVGVNVVPAGKRGIYTLGGTKVSKTLAGHFYIIDGKKTFARDNK